MRDVFLERTTKADILARLGQPTSETSINKPPEALGQQASSKFANAPVIGTLNTLQYQFARAGQSLPGGIQMKIATIVLLDGKLVSFDTVSNFSDDSTNFDENRVLLLKKGSATATEAIAALGPPSGAATYPMVKAHGQKKLIYSYLQPNLMTKQLVVRVAVLLFDANDRLNDYVVASVSSNLPTQSKPAIPGAIRS